MNGMEGWGFGWMMLAGSVVWLVYLGIGIYLLVLATRFVRAVERIADRMGDGG